MARYLVYVSESKVDMLHDQLPASQRGKKSSEFWADLKLIGASHKVEGAESTTVSRLGAVVDWIKRDGGVGTVDEPKQYFRGRLPMRWGPLHKAMVQGVYFAGRTPRTILGLSGSLANVLGAATPEARGLRGHSWAPPGAGLRSLYFGALEMLALAAAGRMEDASPLTTPAYPFLPRLSEEQIAQTMRALAEAGGWPPENLEFVARRLYYQVVGQEAILLGSPVYVAMAD